MDATSSRSEQELVAHLEGLEQAIHQLKEKQRDGLAVTSLELSNSRAGPPIDTQLGKVACPVCFAEVQENSLRKHMANSCGGTELTCPAIGCRERMPASELKVHLEHKCQVTKRRRWLAKQAKTRETEKRMVEAKKQEDALLKRRADALAARELRKHRWPPPEEHPDLLAESLPPLKEGEAIPSEDSGGGEVPSNATMTEASTTVLMYLFVFLL